MRLTLKWIPYSLKYNLWYFRFARLIGRDLAAFYSELGETGKAVVFLMDALRSYEEQGWKDLAAQTRLELVAAAKKNGKMSTGISAYLVGIALDTLWTSGNRVGCALLLIYFVASVLLFSFWMF